MAEVEKGTVVGFSERWQRFAAEDEMGKFSVFELVVPQDVVPGDPVEWRRNPGQARMTVENKRTEEALHVDLLAIGVPRSLAMGLLKTKD